MHELLYYSINFHTFLLYLNQRGNPSRLMLRDETLLECASGKKKSLQCIVAAHLTAEQLNKLSDY